MPSERSDFNDRPESESSALSEVSQLLRAYRRRSGLSQAQLAELAHISPAAIGALEQGSRRAPYRQTIVMLGNALGLSSSERSELEAAANRARGRVKASSPSADSLRSNLPIRLTPFIERDETLKIASLLAEHRLVTITGSAGVGKTRTALEVARQDSDHEAFFVDLSALTQGSLIVGELASILDISLGTGEKQLATITRELRSRRCQLIFDNCEHLIPETAAVIDAVLQACAGVTILATSRERLGLSIEAVYRLPSLAFPPEESTPGDGRQYAALELFIARTQAADIRFEFSLKDILVASQICRELEGIPLAIELAAARVPALGLATVQSRLKHLAVHSIVRDWPARHQTMVAALSWSYELLDEPEKLLLCRLSVFASGFTLDAAEQVCSNPQLTAEVIPALIIQLVRKSLIDVANADGDARYRILESIRAFGLTKLDERGEAEANARRHVAWVTAYARDLHQRNKVVTTNRPQDIDNVRAAIQFCFASLLESDAIAAGSIIGMGRFLWLASDRYSELKGLIDEALARLDELKHGSVVATLLTAKVNLVSNAERPEVARRAVALLAASGDTHRAGSVSSLQAVFLWRAGQIEASKAALLDAESFLSNFPGTDRAKLMFGQHRAWISCEEGNLEEARRGLIEADRALKITDDDSLVPTQASLAAEIEAADGNLAGAVKILEDFIELAKSSERWEPAAVEHLTDTLAVCQVLLGDAEGSIATVRARFDHWQELHAVGLADGLIDTVAAIAAVQNQEIAAVRLTGAADALYTIDGTVRTSLAQRANDLVRASLKAKISENEFAMHYKFGAEMSLDQIQVELAIVLRENLMHS